MKLAVAIAGDTAEASAFVVWRGFESSIGKARECGFHGVELALKTAEEIDSARLSRWLSRHDMAVSCISTGQVFASLGLYFTHPDPEMRRRVTRVLEDLIRLARTFGQMINLGRVRGFAAEGQSLAQAERLFIETAGPVCETAEKHGVRIIIEPVNRYEINFINSLDQGASVIRKLGCGNVGLMPDTFHMNIEEARIGESLVRNGKLIRYIHLADSNRHAPGQGHLDFKEVFTALGRAGYDGWASIEILPVPDPDTAAQRAADYILPMIAAYNAKST